MFLSKFEVSGYRSLRKVILDDLDVINVFYGENGVGKSNILRALELFGRLLTTKQRMVGKNHKGDGFRTHLYDDAALASTGFSRPDLSWGDDQVVTMRGQFRAAYENHEERVDVALTIDFNQSNPVEIDWGPREQPAIKGLKERLGADGVFRIPSHRRLEREELRHEVGESLDALGSDLKRRLFWASVSPDPGLKERFWKRLVPLLKDEPLSLGEPIPVGTSTESVDVRFKRGQGEISVGKLGSGIEQLLLILGLSTLCDAPILALEEPEMNLSWSRQETLRQLLHKMLSHPDGQIRQIFVSSHSPVFAEDPFYDVTMVGDETQVRRRPRSELPYFGKELPAQPAGEVGMLLFDNFVRFPESIVAQLGLEPGHLVFFRREDQRVTILNEEEMHKYLSLDAKDEPKP